MIADYFKIPWKQILSRQKRAWLTLIGIFIGIAAIISLITLGQGLKEGVSQHIQALGSDKLFITAKGSILTMGLSTDAVKITEDDLEVVESTAGIKRVSGMIYTTGRIEINELVRYFYVSGLPLESESLSLIQEAQSFKLDTGRMLEIGDKYKAVLGYAYTEEKLFGQEIMLGDKILIQNQEFKVVGFLEKIGSPPDDQMIMLPLETYWELFGGKKEYGMIIAQTQPGEDPGTVAERLEKELRKSRGLKEGQEDLSIQTPEQLSATFDDVLSMIQIVLVGIAAISLLVGGVGIMNTMYTAVLERTKEIGVMKAVGARNSHILFLFLVESGLYGLVGGMVGAFLGISLAKLAEAALALALGPAFIVIKISWWLVLGTLFFSFVVGCLSGLAPAWRAAHLNPIESLRYE